MLSLISATAMPVGAASAFFWFFCCWPNSSTVAATAACRARRPCTSLPCTPEAERCLPSQRTQAQKPSEETAVDYMLRRQILKVIEPRRLLPNCSLCAQMLDFQTSCAAQASETHHKMCCTQGTLYENVFDRVGLNVEKRSEFKVASGSQHMFLVLAPHLRCTQSGRNWQSDPYN